MITTKPRRWVGRAVLVGLLALVATSCQGTWGLRTSYRNYVTQPFAQGGIVTEQGASWADGTGTGKGPFKWPISSVVIDPANETGSVQFNGVVKTYAHPSGNDHVLELTVGSPRLEMDGDTGTLVADLTYRPFQGQTTTVPPLRSAVDVDFATVDLSGFSWTADANGSFAITGAPMTGIQAAMELIGWDDFYGTNVALDPLTTSFKPSNFPPSLSTTPAITVSETQGLKAGDQIVVWGTGFDPNANTGTRPPLAGQKAGHYAVFGRFAQVWKPSLGSAQAPSSARTVIDQKWALGAASRAIVDPTGTNASYVDIDAYGRWEAVLTIGTTTANPAGNYGVYTYAGSGATNAAQELYVPIQVVTP